MDYLKLYIDFLKRFIKVKRTLRVVFDCSDGVAGIVLKELFKDNKYVDAIFLNAEPDGNFPGHGPNPLIEGALDRLKTEVKKSRHWVESRQSRGSSMKSGDPRFRGESGQKADLGVIFDADGDRVFFVDELGREIDPDVIGFILMKRFKPPYVVSTINSWRVRNIPETFVAKVGHLFMKVSMRENKANFGMERSGHFYFKDFFYCDSGVFTALQVINFLSVIPATEPESRIGRRLDSRLRRNDKVVKISDYIDGLPKYYQIPETNFSAKGGSASGGEIGLENWAENKMEKVRNFYKDKADKISEDDGLLMEFSDWWLSLRLSNSEYLLRLNMEANSQKLLDLKFEELKSLLKS